MIHDKVYLNESKTAYIEVYSLDSDISYNVHKKRPAMIICPGGAYLISAIKEGEAVASQFLSQGYSCFVLRYSTFLKDRESLISDCPHIDENAYYPKQIVQLLETVHLIRENAEVWNIDINAIFATGFSAGGHIVGTVATRWNDSYFTEKLSFTPNGDELKLTGCILGYPMLEGPLLEHPKIELRKQSELMELCLYGHTEPTTSEKKELELIRYISKDTSPIFAWHTTGDEVTSARMTTDFISEVHRCGVEAEYHLFSGGQHGLSTSNKLYAKNNSEINSRIALWLPLVYNWLDYIRKELK
ncbi:alpha/beta hydrolase [Streptococcus chenjunshii]|uniref:Alpha/beta hydrolase n=1 Tax=Streptococcus chenjunshii TaxID=2173853 RepID=A0A372KMP9_9STRE|nr:alpha/beta hydrolase [Streptococcus chenjunshii]AXQ78953.1 alpha/beta hydrolase [Streptococcus chenjunshii]RFU51380.1 alpha/beta hydrolase [Streptococcus chenjunshii]RFU53580.1 alpha/beta hydrolase [Streptococcus chenjunshii]